MLQVIFYLYVVVFSLLALKCLLLNSFSFSFHTGIGDTFTDGSVKYTMTSMNVPEPVMSLAVTPVSKDSGGQVITS